jgi:hypothetical protein
MFHGDPGFRLAYTLILVAMIVGARHERATLSRLVLVPIVAGPVTGIAALTVALASLPLRLLGIGSGSFLQLLYGAALTVVVGYVAGRTLATYTRTSSPLHRRGALVHAVWPGPASQVERASSHASSGASEHKPVTLAGFPVPLGDETKHFKLIGTTGTGKSTAIREILRAALGRGDRVIIADPDGSYLDRFYDRARGDVILNPFHPDAHKWDLFAEMDGDRDIEQLARSLIPDSGDSDRTWSEYARTFFGQLLRRLRSMESRDERLLFRLLTNAPRDELRKLLENTAAEPFVHEGNERMFGSVRSVASSALRALEYTSEQHGAPLSVRHWVRSGAAQSADGRGKVLFLPYKAGEIASLRFMISAWMRLAIFEALDSGEGDQRLWFVVDELDALGAIDGLKDALARLRKFGGRCVLGFQSIAQVTATYPPGAAETIVENCGNTLLLRCSASEQGGGTAEFASRLIGQREVLHVMHARTWSRSFGHPGSTSRTASEQLHIEPAVLASEIEQLPDLEGFLKLASLPDWYRVRLTPESEPSARAQSWAAPVQPAGCSGQGSDSGNPPEATRPAAAPRRGRSQGTRVATPRAHVQATASEPPRTTPVPEARDGGEPG